MAEQFSRLESRDEVLRTGRSCSANTDVALLYSGVAMLFVCANNLISTSSPLCTQDRTRLRSPSPTPLRDPSGDSVALPIHSRRFLSCDEGSA